MKTAFQNTALFSLCIMGLRGGRMLLISLMLSTLLSTPSHRDMSFIRQSPTTPNAYAKLNQPHRLTCKHPSLSQITPLHKHPSRRCNSRKSRYCCCCELYSTSFSPPPPPVEHQHTHTRTFLTLDKIHAVAILSNKI